MPETGSVFLKESAEPHLNHCTQNYIRIDDFLAAFGGYGSTPLCAPPPGQNPRMSYAEKIMKILNTDTDVNTDNTDTDTDTDLNTNNTDTDLFLAPI